MFSRFFKVAYPLASQASLSLARFATAKEITRKYNPNITKEIIAAGTALKNLLNQKKYDELEKYYNRNKEILSKYRNTHIIMITFYKKKKEYKKVYELFIEAQEKWRDQIDHRAVCAVLDCLFKEGLYSRALEFAFKKKDKLSTLSLSIIIKEAANRDDIRTVEEFLSLLKKETVRYPNDVRTIYVSYCGLLIRMGDFESAIKCIEELMSLQFELDQRLYTLLIKACCKLGRWNKVKEYLSVMESRGVQPDTFLLNTIIYQASSESKKDFVSFALEKMAANNISPDVVTFNSLISVAVKRGDDSEGISIFNQLLQSGLEPNENTFTILAKIKSPKFQEYLIEIRKKYEVTSDSKTLADELFRQKFLNFSRVMEIYKQIKDSGRYPGLGCYNIVIQSCAHFNKKEELNEILENDIKYIDERLWNAIVRACVITRQYQRVVKMIENSNYPITYDSIGSIVFAVTSQEVPPEVSETWKKLRDACHLKYQHEKVTLEKEKISAEHDEMFKSILKSLSKKT